MAPRLRDLHGPPQNCSRDLMDKTPPIPRRNLRIRAPSRVFATPALARAPPPSAVSRQPVGHPSHVCGRRDRARGWVVQDVAKLQLAAWSSGMILARAREALGPIPGAAIECFERCAACEPAAVADAASLFSWRAAATTTRPQSVARISVQKIERAFQKAWLRYLSWLKREAGYLGVGSSSLPRVDIGDPGMRGRPRWNLRAAASFQRRSGGGAPESQSIMRAALNATPSPCPLGAPLILPLGLEPGSLGESHAPLPISL